MELKIPKIIRYTLHTNWKSFRILESQEPDGKWVRYSDIEWIIENFNPALQGKGEVKK